MSVITNDRIDGVFDGVIGGGGSQNLFIQPVAPVTSEPTYMWVETNIGGNPANFSFWFEDGL